MIANMYNNDTFWMYRQWVGDTLSGQSGEGISSSELFVTPAKAHMRFRGGDG